MPVTSSVTGVLDLDARVHLHEREGAVLRRRGTPRSRRSRSRPSGRRPPPASQEAVVAWPGPGAGAGASSTTFWCRRCTEQSRSNRCTRPPCRVAQDLHLDVPRPLDGLLEEDGAVAERRRGLPGGAPHGPLDLRGGRGPRAARGRRRQALAFTKSGKPDLSGGLPRASSSSTRASTPAVREGAAGTQHGQAGRGGRVAGRSPCRRSAAARRAAAPTKVMPGRRARPRRARGSLTGTRSRGAARPPPQRTRGLHQEVDVEGSRGRGCPGSPSW